MAFCYNCKKEIRDDEKTKLCDSCKRVLLPFVKFMDASTSSAVRRLVQNERNLRNAGATDSGMEYLLRICELHDKKKMEERDRRNAARQEAAAAELAAVRMPDPTEEFYSEVEVPLDEPLNLIRKPYGGLLTAVQVLFGAAGVGFLVIFVLGLTGETIEWQIPELCGAGACLGGIYAAGIVKKLIRDVEELKKHFR